MAHRFVFYVSFLVLLSPSVCTATDSSVSSSLNDLSHRLSKLEHQQPVPHLADSDDDKLYHFVSRPDIGAPRWNVKIYDQEAVSPGYWFVAPYAKLEQNTYKRWNGPHMYDGNGELVWSGAPMFKHYNTYDFRTVEIGGQQMASLIDRQNSNGIIFDSNYLVNQTIDMVGYLPQWLLDALGDNERVTNMHDFNVIDDGKRVLMMTKVFENATIEESHAIGFEGNCTAKWQGFKEVDMATRTPIFEWSAHGHISLDECTKTEGNLSKACNGNLGRGGWDILHLNSVDKFPDGDYLISSRHTDALYKISHQDGSIVWRIGGVKSDFEFREHARFSRQHHARILEQNQTHTTMSLFDNARGDGKKEHSTSKSSRGLVLLLRTATNPMTAEILAEYEHPLGLYTTARGSVQVLPNKSVFVCWSGSTLQTEHSPDGRLLLKASFKLNGANSYRSYKYPWVGRPLSPPDVHSVAENFGRNDTNTLVHVSWNGATEVATWNLYKTDAVGSQEELVASISRQGFETALLYQGYASFVILEALDTDGKMLGRSNLEKTIPPANSNSVAVVEETQWLQDYAAGSSVSQAQAIVRNLAVVFFLGATSCAAIVAILWSCWRSKKKACFWRRAQEQRYDRLSYDGEENSKFIDQDGRDAGDETLVDEGFDIGDITTRSWVHSNIPH